MIIILPIVFVIIFVLTIIYFQFFKTEGIGRNIIIAVFGLKILAGFGVFLVYTYHYDKETSDLYKYYEGGLAIYESTESNFQDYMRIVTGIQGDLPHLKEIYSKTGHWTKKYDYGLFNDNRTIIRFHALLCLFSQGNIFLHIIVMAYLSFLGCFALFKAINRINHAGKYLIFISSFLIPSCLFWSSGMLKEGLMIFALGYMFYYLIDLSFKFSIISFFMFMIFGFLLLISKIYVLPLFAPALFFIIISGKMKKRYQIISFISVIIFFFVFTISSKNLIGYDIISLVSGKQNDFINYTSLTANHGGSTFEIERLEPETKSIMKNIPSAITNSIFRPFPSEVNSILTALAFVENLIFYILFILMICFFRKLNRERFRFTLFALLAVIPLFILIGLSTPNVGAIVRYKIPVMPFLLAAILYLINIDTIKRIVVREKKVIL